MGKFTTESNPCLLRGPVRTLKIQKMQSESSEYVRTKQVFFTNSWRIKRALESYFDEHGMDVWGISWMKPEVRHDF